MEEMVVPGANVERSQVRSVPGLGVSVAPAHHPEELAYPHHHGGPDQQPFLHLGGPPSDVPSAPVGVGVSMSTLGSYTGPASKEFMAERGNNHTPPRSQGPPLSSHHPSYSSVPQVPPGRKQAMSKETARLAYKAGDFKSINEAVNTGSVTGSQPYVTCESQLPGKGSSGHQPPSQVYRQSPTPAGRGSRRIEARNVEGATRVMSVSQSVGGASQLERYQQQLSSFQQRHPAVASRTEGGRQVAQASSLRNMDIQEERGGVEQHSSSGEDVSAFETAQSGPTPSSSHLYPTLPSMDTSNETQPSSGATPTGSKRTRSQDKQLESSVSEEDKQGEGEEESSQAKRQKTSQSDKEVSVKKEKGASKRVTRSKAKKGGIFSSLSRAYNYVLGRGSKEEASSTETEEQSQEEESNTNTESESEFHDAQEY